VLPVEPDRPRVRPLVPQAQSQEPHERQAVPDQIFRRVISKVVQALQYQDTDHHDRIHRRPAPQAPVPALKRILQKGTEILERNYLAQTLKRIASITQKRMPGIKVEKSWL